jgi:hypothetical protein
MPCAFIATTGWASRSRRRTTEGRSRFHGRAATRTGPIRCQLLPGNLAGTKVLQAAVWASMSKFCPTLHGSRSVIDDERTTNAGVNNSWVC